MPSVRELYAAPNSTSLLFITTDRISCFDVVCDKVPAGTHMFDRKAGIEERELRQLSLEEVEPEYDLGHPRKRGHPDPTLLLLVPIFAVKNTYTANTFPPFRDPAFFDRVCLPEDKGRVDRTKFEGFCTLPEAYHDRAAPHSFPHRKHSPRLHHRLSMGFVQKRWDHARHQASRRVARITKAGEATLDAKYQSRARWTR